MSRTAFLFLCSLILCNQAPAAAPPTSSDQLPPGTVLRLGKSMMIADYGFAVVSPDGKWVYSGKWYDLADGRAKDGPVYIPDKFYLERFFTDGSYLVYHNGRHIYSPHSRTPRIRIAIADQIQAIDETGTFGVQQYSDVDGSEIALVDLRKGTVEKGRQVLAETKCESSASNLSAHGKHVVWIDYTTPIQLCFYDVGAKKLNRIPMPDGFKYPWTAISRDGKFFSCRSEESAVLYRRSDLKRIRLVTGLTGDNRSGGQFTPDGSAWTVQTEHGLAFVPTDPSKPIQMRPVWVSAFFPDWRRVVTITHGHVLRVCDLQTGKQLDPYSRYESFAGVQLLDENRAVSWSDRGRFVTWDIHNGRVLSDATIPPSKVDSFHHMAIRHDGKVAAALTAGKFAGVLVDTATGKVLREIPGTRGVTAGFDADGTVFAVVQPTADEKKTALWKQGCGDLPAREFPMPSGSILPLPDGRTFILANDRATTLYEVATGQPRWTKQVPQLRGESFWNTLILATRDRKGRIVLVRQRSVSFLDAHSGKSLKAIECNGDTRETFHVGALSASGRWMAMWEDEGQLRLFDLQSDIPERPVLIHRLPAQYVRGMALTDDGARLVTAHADGTCLVWNLKAMGQKSKPVKVDAWQSLADVDAQKAQTAISHFLRDHKATVKLFEEKLSAAKRLEPTTNPESLRQLRAVEILEIIGTKDALAILERLANGSPRARLTLEAKSSLERLSRRGEK